LLRALENLLALLRREARIGQAILHARRQLRGGARRAALKIVQIEEHRRAVRRGAEHVAEVSEHVRPNRIALVLGQVLTDLALADEYIEVIEPEVHQHFFQLALGHRRAQKLGLHQFVGTDCAFCCSMRCSATAAVEADSDSAGEAAHQRLRRTSSGPSPALAPVAVAAGGALHQPG
jgi:hypothetical protein